MQGELISWKYLYKIKNFPYLAAEVCSLPYFLSDDFRFMCDYDKGAQKVKLMRTRDSELIGYLPKEALYRSESTDERMNTLEALSCVMIEGSEQVCTYNQQSGLYTEWPVKYGIAKNSEGTSQEEID